MLVIPFPSSRPVRLLQPLNAFSPIVFTESGMVKAPVKAVRFRKALAPTAVIPSPIVSAVADSAHRDHGAGLLSE